MNLATREAYGNTLAELKDNENVVVLEADLGHATKSLKFKEICPQRFFNMGIAEADMIGTAAGLATCGKVPFASTFSVFATGRAFDQVRNSVCYPNLNVKIVGTHAGITVGEDGGTHQAIEDIALMRSLPNMSIVVPSDDVEARAAVLVAAEYKGPMYLRMARVASPTYHNDSYIFTLGKGEIVREGSNLTIIACGLMVIKAMEAAEQLAKEGVSARVINMHTIKPLDHELVICGLMVMKAMEAAEQLAKEGVSARVINMHTIKPLDHKLVIESAKTTGKIITVEEANILGGLGSAVCETVSEYCPVPVKRIGVKDIFGKSGNPDKLLQEYGLTAEHIIEEARKLCK